MNRKEFLSLLPKVILLALAIIMIFFGLFPNFLNGEFVTYEIQSPDEKSMPAEGYLTPVYDPMTLVSIHVSASSNVEVQVYSSAYIKGKVIKDADNVTVIRETWLAAGEDAERIGSDVTLREFSHASAQYRIFVYEPDGSIPSETEYTITVNVYTIDMTFIAVGLLFYTIFIFLGIMEYLKSVNRMLKAGVTGREEAVEASDLEALLEPTAAPAHPGAPAAPEYYPAPAPPPERAPIAPPPPSYEQLYGAPTAPPERAPPAPPAYQPPPPPQAPALVPAPAPAYQPPTPPPQAPPPAYQPPPPAPAPVPAPAPAPAPPMAREPVSKVRCPACKSIVPVYTAERPTPIECPTCGKKGMIR